MRYLMLWAGQKILSGLWILVWPYAIWRWSRAARHIPKAQLKKIHQSCWIGAITVGIFFLTMVTSSENGWWELVFAYYLPWGFHTVEEAQGLAKKYAHKLKTTKSKRIQKNP